MKIDLNYTIDQVREGTEYKGTLSAYNKSIEYKAIFLHSIPDIDSGKVPKPQNVNDLRKILTFSVTQNKKLVALNKEQYDLLAGLLVYKIINFCNSPQTRGENEKNCLVAGAKGFKDICFGLEIVVGMHGTSTVDLSIEQCKVLNSLGFEL